jgi:hypothetical protein
VARRTADLYRCREETVVKQDIHSTRRDEDCGNQRMHCEPESAEHVYRRAREVLNTVSLIADEPDLAPARRTLDPSFADAALSSAERLLADRRAACEHHGGSSAKPELTAALIQVKSVQASLKEAELTRRLTAVKHVHAALQRLRPVGTLAELVEQAPIEINRLGYRRSLVSRLRGTEWAARSAFAHGDPELSEALIRTGTASPGRIGRELPETEIVRRRTPILVEDPQNEPRVHRELVVLAQTHAYIAAPLVARGSVVGILHADYHAETGTVSTFDRYLLGLFAEGLGIAFERTFFYEQLNALRSHLDEQVNSVNDLIDGFLDTEAIAPRGGPNAFAAAPAPGSQSAFLSPPSWPLT